MKESTTMELDDLKAAWKALDQRLDSVATLQRAASREQKLETVRRALRGLTGMLVVELILGIAAALVVGWFLADHIDSARLAIAAAVLHAVAVSSIVAAAWQLSVIRRLDYSQPVITIQRRLAVLGIARRRFDRWIVLGSPLLWTPLAIVAGQGILGLDVFQILGGRWVLANLVFGVAAIPVLVGLTRALEGTPMGSRLLASLADTVAGRSLAAAREQLNQIDQFES